VFEGWAGRPFGAITAGEAAGRPIGGPVATEIVVGTNTDDIILTVVVTVPNDIDDIGCCRFRADDCHFGKRFGV